MYTGKKSNGHETGYEISCPLSFFLNFNFHCFRGFLNYYQWKFWIVLPTYFVGIAPEEQEVQRNGGDQVDNKPTFQVVHRDPARMRDDLVVAADVGGAEVDEDVDDEGDVDCARNGRMNADSTRASHLPIRSMMTMGSSPYRSLFRLL